MADRNAFSLGAALDELQRRFGGRFRERETQPGVGTGPTIQAAPNAERISLTFINLGTSDVIISTTSQVSLLRGILVPQSGGIVSFNVQEDGHLPTVTWWGQSSAINGNFTVLEVMRDVSTEQASG